MHVPVLLQEVIEGLSPKEGDIVLDLTVGEGGHAYEIAGRIGEQGILVAIDADRNAIESARHKLAGTKCITHFHTGNFEDFDNILTDIGITAVDKVLADLGLRSSQIEESGRGFSFQKDEPLLMTFSAETEGSVTAADAVNEWNEDNLADVIYGFGGERYARRIARAIVRHRKEKAIETTGELVEIIKEAVPHRYRKGRIHPATRTFQALRMAVNRELQVLENVLPQAYKRLNPKGRIAVISFHSLEDRIVKRVFKTLKNEEGAYVITKKPIRPSESEIKENPRARSARLRIIEKP